jgi:hypothetical protein
MLLYAFNYYSKVVASKARTRKDPESYSSVCKKLPKLCPRLVPSPLWGLSLAKLARMEPRIAYAISDDCPALVEKIGDYWTSLDRNGVCEVCGGVGNEIDEDWLYYVFTKKGKPVPGTSRVIRKSFRGVAYLKGLRLLCSKCHTAKHQGYALTHGKGGEALEWLQKINGVNDVDEVKCLVNEALSIHNWLSLIEKWSIQIGELNDMDNETKNSVQELLNHMYSREFRLGEGWLHYLLPVEAEDELTMRLEVQETDPLLHEVNKKVGKRLINRYKVWVKCLAEIMENRLESEGVGFIEETFTMLSKSLINAFKKDALFEDLFIWESEGKWIVYVPNFLYEKVFREALEMLEMLGLAYRAEILCEKGRLIEEYLPILVYAPTSFAPNYISSVAKVLKTVLNKFGLTGMMYYEPNIFRDRGIQPKGLGTVIYSYRY